MKSPWLIVTACAAALLGLAPAANARPVGILHVNDIVPILEKEIADHPADAALAYQLGRIHQIAAESGSDVIYDAYRNNPGPGIHFYTHRTDSVFDDEARGGQANLSTADRKAHLLAAIAAYRKAVALAPKDTLGLPIAGLRLAGVLEKAGDLAVDWKIDPPTTQPAPTAAELAQVEREVKQLGSEHIEARAAASNALRQHLQVALPALAAHREDADAEIRRRVATLLDFAPRKAWYEQAANEYRAIVAILKAPRPGGPESDNIVLLNPKISAESWRLDPGQGHDDAARLLYEAAEGLIRMLDAPTRPAMDGERDQTQAIADLLAKHFDVTAHPFNGDE